MNEILSFPHDLVFDNSGILFLSTDEGINKTAISGVISTFVTGNYYGMSFDFKGNLFTLKLENTLSNIDKIGVYGNAIPFLKVDFFAGDLFFDKKNSDLFVNDFLDWSLKKIDVSGNISQFTLGYGLVEDITIDTKGAYYLASYWSIASISSKGTHRWLISNLESPLAI